MAGKKNGAAGRSARGKSSSKKSRMSTEKGAIKKSHRGRLRIALCFPNRYEVGMGNLGFHQVYHLFNEYDYVACERAFLEGKKTAPRTVESDAPISSFDIIAFSIPYEPDILNMGLMLHRAGIPLDPAERADKEAPLIVMGGIAAFLNPEPFAHMADVIAIGEAEPIVPGFLETYDRMAEKTRPELLAALAHSPGLYIPSLYEIEYDRDGRILDRRPLGEDTPSSVRRCFNRDLAGGGAITRVFCEGAEFSDMALVELMRGCVHGCRFCASAYVYRPPRWVRAEAVSRALENGLGCRDKAGLVAASATDHPEFHVIREWVRDHGKTHSVASLRIDQVSAELLEDIRMCGHRTLTVAPEAGTDRLRNVINKPMDNRGMSRAAEMIGASKMPRLKLYFQLGLPFETNDDVDGITPLVAMMKAFLARGAEKKAWPGTLSVSINPFVPKPGTPFQWHGMDKESMLNRKFKHVERALKKIGGVAMSGTSVREAELQALVARGDRRVGVILVRAAVDGQNPLQPFRKKQGDIPNLEWWLTRKREKTELLPWGFIDHRVAPSLLWKDYQRAEVGRPAPECKPGGCDRCDACKEL